MYLQLEEKGICCFLALRVRYVFKASLEIEKSKKNVCRSGIKLVHLAFLMFKKMYSLHLSVSLAVNQNLNFFFFTFKNQTDLQNGLYMFEEVTFKPVTCFGNLPNK